MSLALPKPVRIEDEKYLEFIRAKVCFGIEVLDIEFAEEHAKVCDRLKPQGQCDPNHIRKGVQTGTGTRPSDRRVLPFCRTLHDEYHHIGHVAFLGKYNLTHDQFEQEIRDWNAEYARTQKPKTRADRKPTMRINLSVKDCLGCGRPHRSIPLNKIIVVEETLRFWCLVKREYVEVSL